MKRKCFRFCVGCVSFLVFIMFSNLSFSIGVKANSSYDSVEVEISVPQNYKVEDLVIEGNKVTRVLIPLAGVEGEVGFPEIPVYRRLIEVPRNVDEVDYIIDCWEYYPVEKLRHILYPVQPPWEKTSGKSKPPFTKNDSAYVPGKVYKSEPLTLSYFGIVRGRMLYEMKVNLLQYDTTTNAVRVLKSLRAKIYWKLPKSIEIRDSRYNSPYVDKVWDRLIINERVFKSVEKSRYNVPTGLVVIVSSLVQSASEIPNWVSWKTQRGFAVTVEKVSNIGSTNTAIKQYIKNAYESWEIPPSFVVLLGDVPDVPTFQGVAYNNPPTDLYYSTVDGDEYYTPDLWVGRIPVANATQANTYFQKVIKYEKALWAIPDIWYLKTSFLAGSDNYQITEATHNYVIENYFVPGGFTPQRLYVTSYGATTSDVINAVNEGRGWLVYSGHGSDSSWQDGPVLTQDNIRSFSNNVYPWVLSFACDTGKYTLTECFGETWVRVSGGGVGFLGSSVTSYWDEDDILEKKISEAYFSGSTWTAGVILSGKLSFFNYYGNTSTTQRYFEMYNLLGDPTIEVWKGVIVEPEVSYPNRVLPDGGAVLISVNYQDIVASISNGNTLFGAIRTAIGDNVIPVSPVGSVSSVMLTVSGNPIKPFQVSLPVIPDSNASLMWDRSVYGLNSSPLLLVSDMDIAGRGSVVVNVSSSSGDSEDIVVVETSNSGVFLGTVSITLEVSDINDGYLSVVDGGIITAFYYDEFVEGESPHEKSVSASIDLIPPQIVNYSYSVTTNSAEIDIEASEECTAKVNYDLSCVDVMAYEQVSGSLNSRHKVSLLNLTPDTLYAYKIILEDVAGNKFTSDCLFFRTNRVPDYFTYVYSSALVDVVPLSNHRVYFIPSNSEDFYSAYLEDIFAFPRDIQNQILLTLGDDDYRYIEFPSGTTVRLYGSAYSGCYIGSNGFLTFSSGDSSYNETPSIHFSQPRVSLFFDDLNPSAGGTVGYQFFDDAFVVTFDNVPRYGGGASQSTYVNVQVEMFYDGRIAITWLRCESSSFISGLSRGGGVPSDFVSSDFLSYPTIPNFEGEGSQEGGLEGEGNNEGANEGEGQVEGVVEGALEYYNSADIDKDLKISLNELLRVIQLFNSGGYHCDGTTEDGYAPGIEGDNTCEPHSVDYNPQDWKFSLSELLRCIQFFNMGGYYPCPEGEDGFCVG